MAQALELIEFLPSKLYFISSRCGSTTASSSAAAAFNSGHTSSSSNLVHFIDVAREFPYSGFYLDFGPLSLGHVFAFARKLDAKLEDLQQSGNREARVCVHASGSSPPNGVPQREQELQLHHQHNRANAVCILGCWAILSLGYSAELAFAPFKHLELPHFHDATRGSDSFGLTVFHVLRGLEKALQAQLVSPTAFSINEYFHYEQQEHGDLSWISPQLVAFAGPHDTYAKSATTGAVKLAPEHYVSYFKARNVALVVRLSRKRYDKTRFATAGLAFLDLYFPDGSCPSEAVLNKFLLACESTFSATSGGAIAIHCKAGLGRTGTLIACYLMKTHRFSAEEAVAWLRLCRPGSVVGPQQHYLRAKQAQLWALSPLSEPKVLLEDSAGAHDDAQQPQSQEDMTPPIRKEGIATRQRRRSSLSGTAILKKVDQLRSSTSFLGCGGGSGAGGNAGAKKSHSVSPVGAKVTTTSGAMNSIPTAACSPRPKALLPPRIPGKQEALGSPVKTQGDLLVQRKQEQRQVQVHHPALDSAHVVGLWPFEPRVIM
ncbi:hypothetical protein Gpo141_00001245 [Globisporangium polare]